MNVTGPARDMIMDMVTDMDKATSPVPAWLTTPQALGQGKAGSAAEARPELAGKKITTTALVHVTAEDGMGKGVAKEESVVSSPPIWESVSTVSSQQQVGGSQGPISPILLKRLESKIDSILENSPLPFDRRTEDRRDDSL